MPFMEGDAHEESTTAIQKIRNKLGATELEGRVALCRQERSRHTRRDDMPAGCGALKQMSSEAPPLPATDACRARSRWQGAATHNGARARYP